MRTNVNNWIVCHTGQVVSHFELSARIPIRIELNALTYYLSRLIPTSFRRAFDFVFSHRPEQTTVETQHAIVVLAKHNEEEAIGLKARMKRRRFPVFLNQTLELKRRERHSLLDVPPVVNSNSSNGNACLDEFLGSTVFDSEHAIDKRCPLRLIARVLQSILFGNLTIGLTVMALDKSSYVTFEIDRLAIVLNNALPRLAEHRGHKYGAHSPYTSA